MAIKRVFGVLLAVVILCLMVPLSAAAKEVTISATAYNSSRGTGELVVYTAAYGERTGTNYWGAEVIVDANNTVVDIGLGNSDIPAEGFVLSGHDDDSSPDGSRMKAWINQNIDIGDYVYFDKRTMRITVSDRPLTNVFPTFYAVTKEVAGFNTSRGEDCLVVYLPTNGPSTGTNAYGYEVVVENGTVRSLGGNNSAIPRDGFVVSGHGSMVTWLRSTVLGGMRAEYDRTAGVVRFIYDAQSIHSAVSLAIEDTKSAVDTAKQQFVYADYAAAEAAFADVTAAYQAAKTTYDNGGSDAAFADAGDTALDDLASLRNGLCDSYPVQYRGVWVRPTQTSAAQVEAYVKELHDLGVNTICVEGWFANGVIMNVPEDSLFERHPSFSYDVLQAYIDACHQYGMECHLWMPVMNIGSSVDSGYGRTVVAKRPEWLSLSNKGTPDNESGFMMIDPANEEARAYLVSFYQYLVTTYDIDCLELDYIRYYASGDIDFGYTEAAFQGFEERYGYGVTPTYDPDAPYWNDWVQYRRDCVTEMVRAVRTMIDATAPHVLLAADVAVPLSHALNEVYQEFPRWLEEGLLDILHPMAYGDGYGDEITSFVQQAGDDCVVVPGLGVMTDSLNAPEMERQAREDNSYGAYGDCYFEVQSFLGDKAYEALNKTVYRTPALAPFLDRNASIVASLEYMQGRVDDVLVPLQGVTAEEAASLTQAIAAARASVADAAIGEQALADLKAVIASLANKQAKTVLTADLKRAERIVTVSATASIAPAGDAQPTQPVGQVIADDGTVWIVVAIVGGVLALAVIAAVAFIVLNRGKHEKEE